MGLAGSFTALVVVPVLAIWALVLAISGAAKAWRASKSGQPEAGVTASLSLLGLLLSPLLFLAAFQATDRALAWTALAINHSSYDRIIDLAKQGRLPPPGRTARQFAADGTEFEAERTAPLRIAFALPGGFLSNWNGILYDPSGVGRRTAAVQPDGKSADLLDNWWTIENCSRMLRHYYYCSFS
jgi:hypothetical protein